MEMDARLQSILGDMSDNPRPDRAMNGYMAIGRIVKVHHKNHTCDVKLVYQGSTVAGSVVTEGKSTAKIVEAHGGYDLQYNKYFGTYMPYQKNQLVLLAWGELTKSRPYILGSIHEYDNQKNLFPEVYPIPEDDPERLYEQLSLTRSQDYKYMSGLSDFEAVHHSKAYFIGTGKPIDDTRDTNFEDTLRLKDKITKKTVQLWADEFRPLDYLISVSEKFDESGGLFRFFLSAEEQKFRVLKDAVDSCTYFEVETDGTTRLRRQPSSNVPGEEPYSEIKIDPAGEITITQSSGSVKITVDTAGGVTMDATNKVHINTQDFTVNASTATVNAAAINLNGNTTVNGNFTVNGDSRMNGDLFVDGDVENTGNMQTDGTHQDMRGFHGG